MQGVFPFGYIVPPRTRGARAGVPILETRIASALRAAKDQFLAGKSSTEIARWLDEAGVGPMWAKNWRQGALLKTLANPFYAGFIRVGATYAPDPQTGRRRRTRQTVAGRVVWRVGKHEAMWSWIDHERIKMEFRRRAREAVHRLSGLLHCGLCGRRMRPGRIRVKGAPDDLAWYCRTTPEFWETVVQDREVMQSVSITIARNLKAWRGLAEREGGVRSRAARERRQALKVLDEALTANPAFLEVAPARVVNQLLKGAIEKIIVGAGSVEVVAR